MGLKWSMIWIFVIWDHYWISRSISKKNYIEYKKSFDLQVKLLVLLQIDIVGKLFILDLKNLDTKNVKHSSLQTKWFQISEMMQSRLKA